ncbi:FHA domain-containing protein [Aggregicoccus sp. 17bor-14]|uniref:FHA domain-containing protein n=1 Tax=Myxococcaceae TaxID=31 RepID=UPI00129C10EE|nr:MULTISPECIES: FHA domain-containing protein [Myxococcaceae]MBF5041464.1 FHA domain-containing protein [Simulacricoccus sp. 17bor-14]MRI87248.1 FHA domain-containing protein [Aggregicoccus sp. 17bor-14]
MAPPDPKRPPHPASPEDSQPLELGDAELPDAELPFEAGEVAPLQADDPRPQRVPQFPAGKRSRGRRSGRKDRELAARYEASRVPGTDEAGLPQRFLYVERGPGAGQLLPVEPGSLVIGRSSAAHLRLSHPSISRRHAELTRHGERFALRDLRSQNGTFVNRARVRGEVEIFCGDELRLGSAVLRLRGAGAPRRPAGQPAAPRASSPRRTLLGTASAALLLSLLVGAGLQLWRPPRRVPSAGAEAAVLARYQAGDLDAALALARDEGLEALTPPLAALRADWLGAERALREGAPEAAVAGLRSALVHDAALAHGVGPLARELRGRLSRALGAQGARALQRREWTAAREALGEALRLDPDNREAREALEGLPRP